MKIKKTSLPKKEETRTGVTKDSHLPSHVQEVLEIFQGEIKGEVSPDSLDAKTGRNR